MTDVLLRMSCGVTLGLVLALLLRRPARRVFGAGPAFTLWLLPVVLMLAPLLPRELAPALTVVLPGLAVMPHLSTAATSPTVTIDWTKVLVVLWAIGAAVSLIRLALHYFGLLRSLGTTPGAWARMLAEAAPDLDARRVRVHDSGPAVLWALPRSLILLPRDFAERFDTPVKRGLVLRHELTHARRGDALWNLAMELVSALLWFHPLAWLARPRFRLDQELACDAASLRALPRGVASYARTLLDSVAGQPESVLIPWFAEPQLKERLAMITRIPPGVLRRRAGFAAVAVLLAGGLYVTGGQMPVEAATRNSTAATPPSVDITYKNHNPPRYPVEAVHKGEQGRVALDITIDTRGNPIDVQVDQHGTNAAAVLQLAAIRAAQTWKFNPGMKNGHPVGGMLEVPITFSLHGMSSSAPSCPKGYTYRRGKGGSFSCMAPSSTRASA